MKMRLLTLLGIAACGLMPIGNLYAEETIEEIVVTGSRLVQPNMTGPTGVNVLDREIIDLSGAVNISDLIRTLPATGVSTLSSVNSNFTVNSSGINTVELRNLGEDRTLVLVNGRRFVSGRPGTQQVDLNAIPTAFIDRVDVVTGGASAVYGSDALAGVVNIILKDDFEGVQLTGQSGISDEDDDETYQFNLTAGSNFADDRGNAMINIGWDKRRGVYARNRDTMEVDSAALGYFTGNNSDFDKHFTPFFSSFSEKGRIGIQGDSALGGGQYVLDDDGTVRPFVSAQDGFNRQAYRALSVPTERLQFAGVLNFDITDSATFYTEVNYSSTESQSSLEPFPLGSDDIYDSAPICDATGCTNGVPLTNPYVPEDMLTIARAASPGIADEDLVLAFARRTTELDQRGADNLRQTFRGVAGVKGDIGEFHYDASINYGRTTQSQRSSGQINVLNMRNAFNAEDDGTGNIICSDPIARAQGCIPVNIFGTGSITAGLDDQTRRNLLTYLQAPASTQAKIEQTVASGFVSGPMFELPAGDVRFVIGGEYREEKSESYGDALSQQGLNAGNAIPPTVGSFDVWELFGELEIPIITGKRFAESLELSLAGRWSDYSTVGRTTAYAASIQYVPADDYMFRAQYAEAVRAPNISELFQPLNQTFENVNDPCEGVTVDPGSSQAAYYNLRRDPQFDPALVIASGIDSTTIGDPIATTCLQDPNIASRVAATQGLILTQPEIQGVSGFNGGAAAGGFSLEEESSDSYSVGFVWNPSFAEWAEGFAMTIDWYKIEIENAISSIDRQVALDNCYSAATYQAGSQFCSGILRFNNTASIGALEFTNEFTQNIATAEVEGVDVQASYLFDIGRFGLLNASVTWSHLITDETVAFAGAPVDDTQGTIGSPENEALVSLVYDVGSFQVAWTTQIIGESDVVGWEPEKIDTQYFHDIHGRYRLNDNVEFFLGVDNVTDEYVEIGAFALDADLQPIGWTTAPDVYDGYGRKYYAGFRVQM
jgi:outer membrane receptor protein involved in Fe transport